MGLPRGGTGLVLFPVVPVGPEKDISTEFPHLLSTDGLRLSTTEILPYDGPATGAISVSGRAASGSGLVVNSDLSE